MELSGGPFSASTAPLPVRLTHIDEHTDLSSTFDICPAFTVYNNTHASPLALNYFPQFTSSFKQQTRNLRLFYFFRSIVSDHAVSSPTVPVCLLIPDASAFEMVPPVFIAHQGDLPFPWFNTVSYLAGKGTIKHHMLLLWTRS